MSLPTGAISMLDICTAYGRGAAGYSGFQNYYPYALGEYYRGGIYVPLYDTSSPYGTQATSQSNVDMNSMRGSGGYTHSSTLVAGSRFDGKFYSYGYGSGISGGTMNDTSIKCYAKNISYLATGIGGLSLQVNQGTSALQGTGWYSIQVTKTDFTVNYILLRSAATFSQSGTTATWNWTSGFTGFTAGASYNIRIRLTSLY